MGLVVGIRDQRLGHRLKNTGDGVGQHFAQLIGRDFLVETVAFERTHELACRGHAHIGGNQQLLQLIQGLGIKPVIGEDFRHAIADAFRGTAHPQAQPRQPAPCYLLRHAAASPGKVSALETEVTLATSSPSSAAALTPVTLA